MHLVIHENKLIIMHLDAQKKDNSHGCVIGSPTSKRSLGIHKDGIMWINMHMYVQILWGKLTVK